MRFDARIGGILVAPRRTLARLVDGEARARDVVWLLAAKLVAGQLPEVVRAGLLARGASAVSEAAAECLRVERGRPRYGLDIDEHTIPQEAGLNERAVSFSKGCYVGQ